MGLDITYYSDLAFMDAVFDEDGEPINPLTREPIEDCFQAYLNPHFPTHGDEIKDRGVYSYVEAGAFRAGSYGGYNNWREHLAEVAGYEAVDAEDDYRKGTKRHDAGAHKAGEGPFFELIWFSDCEGVIGPKTSAKLAKDFADFQSKADADPDEYWRGKYNEWRKAFEVASNNGAVDFH